MKNKKKCQESKYKFKVVFFSVTGLELSHNKLQITISFQEFALKIGTSYK